MRHSEVLQETLDNPHYQFRVGDCPWIIAALSFTGRVPEAEGIFHSWKGQLTPRDLIVSQYFLGLGVCRARRNEEAYRLFTANLLAFRTFKASSLESGRSIHDDQLLSFFVWHGIAFLRYSTGYFKKSLRWTDKALKAATASLMPFASVLALELSGHVLLQLGSVRRGMKNLDLAKSKAALAGYSGLVEVLESVMRLYSATYGLNDSQTVLSELNEGLVRVNFENSYTRASLLIQLSQCLRLSGRLDEALGTLEKASNLVYQVDNPYLEALYNLSLASIQLKKGAPHVALSIAKAGVNQHGRAHLPSTIRSLELQSAIMSQLGLHREKLIVDEELRRLTKLTGGYISARILSRNESVEMLLPRGEDPLGDLIDDVKSEKTGILSEIFKSGWLDCLRVALNIQPQEALIYLDLEPGSVTIFKNGNIYHKVDGASDLIRKTLMLLNQYREIGKEQFTQKLWGQEYHPFRHDNLIYGLIARTRKLLSPYQSSIEVTESRYRLEDQLLVRIYKSPNVKTYENSQDPQIELAANLASNDREKPGKATLPAHASNGQHLSLLNLRQIKILERAEEGHPVQPKDLVDDFSISDATATRDLSRLVELGFMVRRGSGRATFYLVNNTTN